MVSCLCQGFVGWNCLVCRIDVFISLCNRTWKHTTVQHETSWNMIEIDTSERCNKYLHISSPNVFDIRYFSNYGYCLHLVQHQSRSAWSINIRCIIHSQSYFCPLTTHLVAWGPGHALIEAALERKRCYCPASLSADLMGGFLSNMLDFCCTCNSCRDSFTGNTTNETLGGCLLKENHYT